jgi:2-keto-4-pentenoate hydratase/2-oxohepta-3-ene-1,7-dioic acid hydratase in catechol pathway
MRIYRYQLSGVPRLALQFEDHVYDAEELYIAARREIPSVVKSANLKELAAAPDTLTAFAFDLLRQNNPASFPLTIQMDTMRILPPIPAPDKIICIGLNYLDHCIEQGKEPPVTPVIFAKFANSVIGHGDKIVKPRITEKLDFEGELGVVIGRGGRNIPRETALEHVFGYVAAHDVSARDLQKSDGQWLRAKSLDTFFPFGPCITTTDEIPDPQNLAIQTRVNGQVLQKSNTSQMTFTVAHLVSFISEGITLNPGDVISTGTPAGVGVHRKPPLLLQAGDQVEIEIEKIGILKNEIVNG